MGFEACALNISAPSDVLIKSVQQLDYFKFVNPWNWNALDRFHRIKNNAKRASISSHGIDLKELK